MGDKRPVRKFYPETGDDFPIDELIYYDDEPAVTEPWTQEWVNDTYVPDYEQYTVPEMPSRVFPPAP